MDSSTQQMTFAQFAQLLALESARNIINGREVMMQVLQNILPHEIKDKESGEVRLAVTRDGDRLNVTSYLTQTAIESINDIAA